MNLDNSQFEILKNEMPTRKEEGWKYTSLTEFKKIPWTAPTAGQESALSHDQMQQISRHLPAEFFNLVFVDGHLNRTLSDELNTQIEILSVDESDLMVKTEPHVEKGVLQFAKLNLSKKIKISLTPHQVMEKPVHIVLVESSGSLEFRSEKIDIHVGKSAQATILTQSISLNEDSVGGLNLHLNLSVDESANVKLIQIQNENLKSYHFAQTEVQLSSRVQFLSFVMSLGGHLVRNYFHLELLGQGADAGVYGLNALSDVQHVDHYTFIQHKTGGNESRQLYKSVLSDGSHSVFRGRVRIEKDAQKANSEQLNNNLLLTREAQADSIPQLEIYADDVKAGHGSTVGQLNKEEIFYFLSRGINQYQAVRMLSFGFAKALIYKFENEVLQNWMLKILNKKLDGMIKND